jgi:hypothetical protein
VSTHFSIRFGGGVDNNVRKTGEEHVELSSGDGKEGSAEDSGEGSLVQAIQIDNGRVGHCSKAGQYSAAASASRCSRVDVASNSSASGGESSVVEASTVKGDVEEVVVDIQSVIGSRNGRV